MNLNEFKKFAQLLAEKSGVIIAEYFRTKITVETKIDASPVTYADKKSEEVMRELIMKEFPEHGIMGEEFGYYNKNADYQWVLDPIDGTKSFICGAYSFGTLIALTYKNEPLIGVINQPVLKDFLIGDNNSTELNGNKVEVRNCSKLSDAVLLTTDHLNIEKYQDIEKFNSLIHNVKLYRNWGDCYGYYLLATGYADIMIDAIMSPWDTIALIPIIRGAGGIITDYHGNNAIDGNSVIAASPFIHRKVIKILNN